MLKKSYLYSGSSMLLAASALFFVACGEQGVDSAAPSEDVVIPAAVDASALVEPALVEPAVIEPAVIEPALVEPAVVEAAVEVVAEVASIAEQAGAELVAAVAEAVTPIEVPESELIEMLGYLTAQSGGVASLQLDEASVAALADGLKQGLGGEVDFQDLPQEAMQAAFGQAQARAEAVQSGATEIPAITPDALKKIGLVMVLQSGLQELGFGAEDADLIVKGFTAGALATEMDPSIAAKMPAFQAFIEPRAVAAQAEAEAAQVAAQAAAEVDGAKFAAENLTVSKAFFETLSADAEVQSSESGLHYKVLEAGSEPKPTMADSVLVHYKGTLIDGTQFDSSYDRGAPATFPLGGVVKGFGEGLTKIGAGGKVILYIASDLGYGNTPRPGGPIKPGDTLIFECELIEINPGS
jgi:FKBP-type peptidyl-prolyl cis-trans isomerase